MLTEGKKMEKLVPETAASIALSIEEACRRSSLGRTKFHELMNSNVIPSYKAGRRRIVLQDEFHQALKSLPRAAGCS